MEPESNFLRLTAHTVGTLAAVAAVTLVFARWIPVNPTTAGFIYLITILLVAASWGLRTSVIGSFAATLCFNYFFFPPVGTFTIADPHNWVALSAFLATSLIASELSERARRRTEEALRRQREMERLYELSRAILLTSPNQPFAQQIAEEIRRIYELAAVAVYDPADLPRDSQNPSPPEHTMRPAGTLALPNVARKLAEAAVKGILFQDTPTRTTVTSITLGGRPIGGLALQGATLSAAGLQALSNLVAVGLERVRAEETAARAEAARQSEEFKSTLLDALAHEFKTPLTSLKAAASAILSNGVTSPADQRELLTVINQDADRMTALVTEATRLARIEAGKIRLRRELHSIPELIQPVLKQMEIPLESRTVEVSVPGSVPSIAVDSDLFHLALKQLLDNALKYSPPDSPLSIRASTNGDAVSIRLHNEGAGIPEDERERIFERFYRGSSARRQGAGSGMGLFIAREILQAHGGDLRVESNPGEGAEFIVSLPLPSPEPNSGETQ